jgi:hypothetical protein
MCNVYLHRLDREWDDRDGVLCRYADDLVVMCWSRSQAEAALARLTTLLADLGLEPKAAKTRIVHLEAGVLTSSASITWTPTGFVDTTRSGTMVYEERTGNGSGPQEVHPAV